MNITELIYGSLLQMNRFLFQWSRWTLRQSNKEITTRAKKLSNTQYRAVLQEFVLLKTKYQVWTRALNKKIKPKQEIFEVKVFK